MCSCIQLHSSLRWPVSQQADLRKLLGVSEKRCRFIVMQRKGEAQQGSGTCITVHLKLSFNWLPFLESHLSKGANHLQIVILSMK